MSWFDAVIVINGGFVVDFVVVIGGFVLLLLIDKYCEISNLIIIIFCNIMKYINIQYFWQQMGIRNILNNTT